MSISSLLNVPETQQHWDQWSLNHRISHDNIVQAINKQKKLQLQAYLLDPIPSSAIADWLERNQQAHTDMNGALKLQNSDLSEVDFKNKEQLKAWIYEHWQQHQAAARALRI